MINLIFKLLSTQEIFAPKPVPETIIECLLRWLNFIIEFTYGRTQEAVSTSILMVKFVIGCYMELLNLVMVMTFFIIMYKVVKSTYGRPMPPKETKKETCIDSNAQSFVNIYNTSSSDTRNKRMSDSRGIEFTSDLTLSEWFKLHEFYLKNNFPESEWTHRTIYNLSHNNPKLIKLELDQLDNYTPDLEGYTRLKNRLLGNSCKQGNNHLTRLSTLQNREQKQSETVAQYGECISIMGKGIFSKEDELINIFLSGLRSDRIREGIALKQSRRKEKQREMNLDELIKYGSSLERAYSSTNFGQYKYITTTDSSDNGVKTVRWSNNNQYIKGYQHNRNNIYNNNNNNNNRDNFYRNNNNNNLNNSENSFSKHNNIYNYDKNNNYNDRFSNYQKPYNNGEITTNHNNNNVNNTIQANRSDQADSQTIKPQVMSLESVDLITGIAKINSIPANYLLDTGASHTVISREFYFEVNKLSERQIVLSKYRGPYILSAESKIGVIGIAKVNLSVTGSTLKKVKVLVIDHLNKYDCIIGMDVLSKMKNTNRLIQELRNQVQNNINQDSTESLNISSHSQVSSTEDEKIIFPGFSNNEMNNPNIQKDELSAVTIG